MTMANSGAHISIGIAGFSVTEKLAGWWSVNHQSTLNLMIGKLISPTTAKTAAARPPD
jgi:hypothetical protein